MDISLETIRQIDAVFQEALADGRTALFEFEVFAILRCLGLPAPEFVFVTDPAAVDDGLLARFGPEIVLKVVSPEIAHKQKLGGVRILRHHDPLFIQYAMERMRQEILAGFPAGRQPAIRGFLLEEFVPHTQALGYESLIGIKEDPAFGPVLTLSKGGDDAEFFAKYFDPANLFLPPMDADYARRMLDGLHIKHKFEQKIGRASCRERV